MEVRLNNRRKLKQILGKFKYKGELVFSHLYNETISKAILTAYWKTVMDKYELLEYKPKDAKDFIKTFMANNPKVGLRKTVQVYGLLTALDELGVREYY